MTINAQKLIIELSIKELEVWMAALRLAARERTVKVVPWDSCCFLKQHNEIVNLTGYGLQDQNDLIEYLKNKNRNE
jgi:hypothetical protein